MMRKTMIALLGLGLILVVVGVLGTTLGTDINAKVAINQNLDSAVQMTSWNDDYHSGMMGQRSNSFNNEDYSNVDKLDFETLEDRVNDYLDEFEEALEIADIFIFSDTDYYYSIVEKDTGMGAMELLVNPYTGNVYLEYGPNMMWNLKYGMMRNQNTYGYGGMMRNQNRSEQWYDDYDNDNYVLDGEIEVNKLSFDEALSKGNEFLKRQPGGYSLSDSYHEFYGYFTFHVENEGDASGMLSVNAFTGEVWFHDWHGDLIEIAGSHEEKEH
jgi:hypothetical protein